MKMPKVRRKKKAGEQASSSSKRPRATTVDLARNKQHDFDEHIDSDDDEQEIQDDNYQLRKQQEPSLHEEQSDSSSEEEAPDVKRVRLARQYLDTIDSHLADDESSSSSDDSSPQNDDDDLNQHDNDDDRIGRKLQRDRLKREGALERFLANKVERRVRQIQESVANERPALLSPREAALEWVRQGHVHLLPGHDLTPTSVALVVVPGKQQQQQCLILSGSKDHSVILWDAHAKCRIRTLYPAWKKKIMQASNGTNSNNNHRKTNNQQQQNQRAARTRGQVLSVAVSDDGHLAAVGKRDGTVDIFDISAASESATTKNADDSTTIATNQYLIQTLTGHKAAVTCVTFRTHSRELFTGSDDRCLRHYNLENCSGADSNNNNNNTSASSYLYLETLYGHQFGVTAVDCHRHERPVSVGRDRTARAWKLAEDTHLIFRGGSKLQSAGCVALIKDDWFVTGHENGHVCLWLVDKKRAVATVEHAHGVGRDVVSVAVCRGSDVAATGSSDGYLRLWKVMTGATVEERGIERLCQIPVAGYINSIAFEPKARFCVLAVGQEHRSGRWDRVKGAKNRVAIVSLNSNSSDNDDSDSDADEKGGESIQVDDSSANHFNDAVSESASSKSDGDSSDSD